MERQKYLITIILMMVSSSNLIASYKSDVYKAYISSNMNLWKKVIDEMNQIKPITNALRVELLNYQYGYSAWCLGNDKNELAVRYIEAGEKNMAILEKAEHSKSLVTSYKAAFYGFRIGLNTFKAPFLGPRSVECAKMAIELDPNNPYGYLQYANTEFYKPAVLGGSKTIALVYFKKAEKLMELNSEQIKQDWNYLSLLTMIAKTHTELNDFITAKAYYQKILKIEPNFLWVKNILYPDLLKKIK